MAGKISVYDFGGGGVNLVKDPLELADNESTQLQNAEFVPDQASGGRGALHKRGGLAVLTTGLSSVAGAIGVALATTYTRTIYAGRGSQNANKFATSTDGTSWSNISTPSAPMIQSLYVNDSTGNRDSNRMVTFRNYILYPYGGFTEGTDKPTVLYWDGSINGTVATVPQGPSATAATPAYNVSDMLTANGKVYIAVHDPGGSSPSLAGRVMAIDLSTGEITQVAAPFGNGTGETTGGYPDCMAWYQGQLWVGLNGKATTDGIGKVVRCYPDVDTTWTTDVSNLSGHPASMTVFNGELYVGTRSSVATGAKIYKRAASSGAYTASVTSGSGAGDNGFYGSLVVYSSKIYAVEYYQTTDVLKVVSSSDGTTFASDRDLLSSGDTAASPPPFPQGTLVFNNGAELYMVFRASSDGGTDGLIMQKKASVWTKVTTGNYNGQIAQLVQRS